MYRPFRIRAVFFAILSMGVSLSAQATCETIEESAAASARRQAVVARLFPAVVDSLTGGGAAISKRMEHFAVPAVSIALVNDGRLEWAAAYGMKTAGGSDPACISTLFQAASISKPVAAFAALRLVDRKLLNLDQDVNQSLRSWRVPANGFTDQQSVTLRLILSHRAGLTISGFPGYAVGEIAPSAVDVLNGRGNTGAVLVDTLPGTTFRYSGGGYVVAQTLIEDVTRKPFSDSLQQLVLAPMGMKRSTFIQPLPKKLVNDAASGHVDGKLVQGRWHVYPELAPAGLWTTASDLTRFALGIRTAWRGDKGALLELATAREMLTPHDPGGYGLGPGLGGSGESLLFAHPGGNFGFSAFMVMYASSGDGIVVMNNGGSSELNMEIVRAAATAYDWPHFKPEVRTTAK